MLSANSILSADFFLNAYLKWRISIDPLKGMISLEQLSKPQIALIFRVFNVSNFKSAPPLKTFAFGLRVLGWFFFPALFNLNFGVGAG